MVALYAEGLPAEFRGHGTRGQWRCSSHAPQKNGGISITTVPVHESVRYSGSKFESLFTLTVIKLLEVTKLLSCWMDAIGLSVGLD